METNKSEEILISEYLDLMDTVIEENKSSLLSSNIIKDMIIIFERIMRFYNHYAVRRIIKLLRVLSEMKEAIIDNLLLESDLITLVCKHIRNFQFKDAFYSELYYVSKQNYDTILLSDALNFLINMISSNLLKSGNSKYLRPFNSQNLTQLFGLFNEIYDKVDTDNKEIPPEEILIFEKYKDLPGFDLLNVIFEILKACYDHYITSIYENENFRQELSVDAVIAFLETGLKEIEVKYQKILESNGNIEDAPEPIYDEFHIYTQSRQEAEKQLWTTFTFGGDNITFSQITKTIEKHYNNQLHLYYYNEKNKIFLRIKDESDFEDVLNNVVLETRLNKKSVVSFKLFVDDDSSSKKVKYIVNCVNCSRRMELDEKDYNNKETNTVCELCKNAILNQIVTNLSFKSRVNTATGMYFHK